ncbi:MAG: FAD-dependent oxidoreductase, partial [Pseudomonadota bacterium]
MSEAPVIIVGAGIGGLTAALELAVKGCPVLVLERQKTVGGKMRQVHFDGFAGIDSGPTVFTMRWVFDELFDNLGLDFNAEVPLKKLDLLARHGWPDGSRLDLFADTERSADAIGTFAGSEDASAYRQFAKTSADVFETLDRTFMRASRPNPLSLTARIARQNVRGMTAIHPFRTLAAELARTFRDPRLQQLFGRYATYTGGSPYLAPATLMLIAHAERCGVWIADGGMHALATTFADLVTQHGGTVRCGVHVSDISVSGGRASGVQLADGEAIAASAIIFNGDISALGAGHLGAATADKHKRQAVQPADRSQSAITWSAIARGASDDIAPHTVAFGPDYASEFA